MRPLFVMRHVGMLALLLLSGLLTGCERGPRPTASPSPVAHASSPAASSGSAPRAPVVLAIVVDQLSSWLAASRLPELPRDGGFARLVREGTWVKDLRYPYSVTDTAPGHAALNTGMVPAESGVFANEVPDAKGDPVSILRDPATRLLMPEGASERVGSSSAALRVETVADRLRAAHPDALVVSVSLKDRGAILPAGKTPSHVLWYDARSGAFVTSTAFTPAYPEWAVTLASAATNEGRRKVPWTVLDPAWVEARAATPDDAPGEGDFEGLGRVFPHVARTPGSFRATPASDAALVDLALAALDAEHRSSRPTLLLVSFSAHDIVSHIFGPDSWEAWDYLRRLDASLARLVEGVEKRVGDVRVLLSADHGGVSMPETQAARRALCDGKDGDALERPCKGGRRIPPERLRDELRAASVKALGSGTWIAGVAEPYVFLTREARALPVGQRASLDEAVRAVLANHRDAIEEVLDARALEGECPAKLKSAAGVPGRARPGEDALTLVCRSWSPGIGAGDYYVVPKRGSFFDPDYVPGHGTSHGTPYLYDRTVPLLVRARGSIDEGRVIEGGVDFSAYAALEAAFLGLDATPPRYVLERLRASSSDAK